MFQQFETLGAGVFSQTSSFQNKIICPCKNELILSSIPAFDAEPASADRHLISYRLEWEILPKWLSACVGGYIDHINSEGLPCGSISSLGALGDCGIDLVSSTLKC